MGQLHHLWLEQGGLDGRHSSSLSGHGTLSQLPHLSSSFLSSKMRVIVPSFWSHRVIVGGGGEGKMKEFQRPQGVVADVTGNELCHLTAPHTVLSAFDGHFLWAAILAPPEHPAPNRGLPVGLCSTPSVVTSVPCTRALPSLHPAPC